MKNQTTPLNICVALLLFSFLYSMASFGARLECNHIPQILEVYLQRHYRYKNMDDELRKRTVDQFIKYVDPSKTFIMEGDLPSVRASLLKVFETAKRGDCSPLFETTKLLESRAVSDEKFVKEFLGPKYQLDQNTELIIDTKKRKYSKTDAERQNLLKKMIHFQISNIMISKVKLPEAKKQLIHRYELSLKRLREEKPTEAISNFANSFATSLDPHSSFLSPESLEDFQIMMGLSLEGIGASLRGQDGFTVIEELIKGGSADRSKTLKPKDKIIAVGQDKGTPVSTVDMDLRDVVKMIRGKKGTKVTLTILRQSDTTETFQTTLVRDKIDLVDQAAKLTYETRTIQGKTYKFGIIDLPSFYGTGGKGERSCSADIRALISQAKKENVHGIVLNVSRNGGGLLEEAVKISGLFIRSGAVVATKNTSAKTEILSDEDKGIEYQGPLVVLTSRLSASASEILAGALKDYRRAVIVGGDHTFGKGSVQLLSNLPDGLGGLKVTTGMFFVPGGASTQSTGVTSDIVLPSVFNNDEIGEGTLDFALPPQKIPSFTSKEANADGKEPHWSPISESTLEKLGALSKKRVAKDPNFLEIDKRIVKAKKNNGTVKLADVHRESKEKEAKKSAKKSVKSPVDSEEPDDEDEKQPFTQEAVNVLADLVLIEGSAP